MSDPYKTYARKCDTAMRRSKEKCLTPNFNKWTCTEDCRNCICCLEKHYDGTWGHFNPRFTGERKEDEFQTEGE